MLVAAGTAAPATAFAPFAAAVVVLVVVDIFAAVV